MPVLAPVITTTLPSIRALLSTLVIDQETIIDNRNLPPLSPASESRPPQCCHKCHQCTTGQTHRRLKRRGFCFQEEVELVFTFISWGCVACTLRFVLNTDIFLQYFNNFDRNQLVCNVKYDCSMQVQRTWNQEQMWTFSPAQKCAVWVKKLAALWMQC